MAYVYRLPACRCQFAPALSALVTSDDRPGRGGVVSAASQWQRCLLTVVLSMCAARWMTRPASVSDRLSWCDGLTGCVEQHSPNRAPRRHAVYFQLHLNGECLLAVVLSMCAARCMTRPASVSVRASWIRGDGPAARAGRRPRACVRRPSYRGTNRSRLSVPAAFNVGVFSASMDVRLCRLCARLDSAAISRMDAVHHVSSAADIEYPMSYATLSRHLLTRSSAHAAP